MIQKQETGGEKDTVFGLWKLFDHTRFMIARSREMELARFGITPEQSHILDLLSNKGGITTINEIVDFTQRQHHSISTLVNRMSKQGLLKKRKDPKDNRKYEVVITPKGQKLFQQITRDSIKNTFSSLSPEDQKVLREYLQRLLAKAYDLLGKEIKVRF